MQRKSEDFKTWYELFKYLNQEFKARKYPDYENEYSKFIYDFDGFPCDEDRIVGEEFENTQIGIDGLDYYRLNNDEEYRRELGIKGEYITLIRDDVNRIVDTFDKIIYYGFFIDEKENNDGLTELLNSNLPSQTALNCVFLTNNCTAEIIINIIDKLLDKNYLPSNNEILEYFNSCLYDFNVLLIFFLEFKEQIVNSTIDTEENVYECEDLNKLIEKIRYYKRKLINHHLHPDIEKLIGHYCLQHEYVLRKHEAEKYSPRPITFSNSIQKTQNSGLDQHSSPSCTECEGMVDMETQQLCAKDFIGFMNGKNNLNGDPIMHESDYLWLEKYTQQLMDYCIVPTIINPLPKINLDNGVICYTFKRIHDNQIKIKKRKKEYFIFLDKVFAQLHNPEFGEVTETNYMDSNSYKKFSTKPQYYDILIK